ncbi:MAG TPA: glycosyltransferase [Gaiellaceae bacterium]|nr:glycosyltransferase [Gaiellaceae bacterium]
MPAAPLISVVVPAFNAARFLGATLDSVVAQTEERWECVVVDDGSTDATVAVAEDRQARDPRIRVVRAAHHGPSHARNEGFRRIAAGSQFVTFMDADDVWLPHALATLLERLERSDRFVGSHGLAELIDAEGRRFAPGVYAERGRTRLGLAGRRLVRWPLDRPTTFDVLVNGNVLFPPGLLLARRRAYELAGPFDESLPVAEDWDMLIRLSRLGDLAFVDDVILEYRRHDANQGAQPSTPELAWRVRCIAFHSAENTAEQRRRARRGWRAYQVHLAAERLGAAGAALAHGRVLPAARHLARLPVYAWRYLRGYPLPRVTRPPLVWSPEEPTT